MNKSFVLSSVWTVLCAASFIACSAKYETAASAAEYNTSRERGYVSAESVIQYDDGNQFTGDEGAPQYSAAITERKLVKRANLRVRVEDLAAADASINELMRAHGAYAASTETGENSRSYLIRVPHRAYDAFLAGMDGMGRSLYRSESAEDVTLRYYDLEGRLATKQELLKTFQSYLGKAKNIEEILSVEARIADLQNEIDGTGTEFRYLVNLVDFAAIELFVYGPVAAVSYRGPSLGERIKELFSGFSGFVSTVLVVLTGIVIYGIPVILLFALLFLLLFGRIGLMKKLWHLVMGRKRKNPDKIEGNTTP